MKLVGICKIFKLEEVSPKCAKGQIYFSTKRGEDENGNAEFETSFINARVVGKAKNPFATGHGWKSIIFSHI